MKGKKKTPKVAGFMRSIFAQNVVALVQKHYASSKNKPKDFAKAAGVSLSTAQRIMAGKTGATLDNIESIAEAFDLSVYQILLPSLDVNNPQIVKGASKTEQLAYRGWRRHKGTLPEEEKETVHE